VRGRANCAAFSISTLADFMEVADDLEVLIEVLVQIGKILDDRLSCVLMSP